MLNKKIILLCGISGNTELQAARCGSIQGQCAYGQRLKMEMQHVMHELKEVTAGDVTFHIKHQWGLHNGVIVLLQNNVCFGVLALLGLSLAWTTLQRVHNIWHRWRRKDWWFKFKNKAVLYLEGWGQASFQRRGY